MRLKLRWLLLYFAMIGIPIGIAASALRIGRDLTAPISLRGHWTVRSEGTIASGRRCLPSRDRIERTWSFEITQAGRDITIRVRRPYPMTLRGQLRNGTLVARTGDIVMRARVDRYDESRAARMAGTIRFLRCPLVEVPFQAHFEQTFPDR